MEEFAHEMTTSMYGNPHSASWSSQQSTARIENTRLHLLDFFNADPNEFDLVFVANATAGVKLVVEAMRSLPQGFLYAHHQSCHTSVVGAREEAKASICLQDGDVKTWIEGESPFGRTHESASATLVAFSGQSHFDGRRYPLSWSSSLRTHRPTLLPRVYTLLDAASLAATSPIDLSAAETAPDFTVLSLYKIFGFPDLGALIVRRSAEGVFNNRRYFGGGTVDMVVCGKEKWHAPKTQFLHERLEDGTLPFHNIIAADIALTVHKRLFGSMGQVKEHTSDLARQMTIGLKELRHGNGRSVCQLYTEHDPDLGRGPIVSFNIRNAAGAWVSLAEFDKLAVLKKMHVRTGSLCSPGGVASALHLQPWEMRRNFSAGFRCGTDGDIMSGKPTGVVRVSLGAMSSKSDVLRFLDFMREFFVEQAPAETVEQLRNEANPSIGGLRVKSITVYPVKSCGGFVVSPGTPWTVRPEGLAWDREWCLVHRGSGQALSQKRYPHMALLKPDLDFERGVLRIRYEADTEPQKSPAPTIEIPLSVNPALFDSNIRQMPSRVCGEEISPYMYSSPEVNDFFSNALGISCVLTRFPPGGRGLKSRLSKARVQSHQRREASRRLPGTFPDDVPSPPDSDTENARENKILLANESPILMIHAASVKALNKEITSSGGSAVDEASFRANIILETVPGQGESQPYAEDTWDSLQIGTQSFKLLGACRRCQMVCVDQSRGEKREEPFTTLAKTRRFDGKVYFGCHMRHDPQVAAAQPPSILTGDLVTVDPSG